jgi:hypothetical protein
MVTIISENGDVSSNEVIEYLISQNTTFSRKNEADFSQFSYCIKNEKSSYSNVIWHRRGQFYLNPNETLIRELTGFLKSEELITNYSYEKINKQINKYYIGGVFDEDLHEKVLDLYLAKECGLKIPDTLITNIKEDLINFKKKYGRIITKPIKNPYIYIEKEEIYFTDHNFLVEDNYIEQLDNYFTISKYQEYIEKEIEVRIFYFDGIFFSMAIFSQNDDKTKIDFRNYNHQKLNKEVPFTLPKYIIRKLKKLLKKKNINTCSIDLILTPENEFVFLEINPQGQFGWVSKNCNYYIEKFIAQKLTTNEKVIK